VDLGSRRPVSSAGGMLKPHALFSALDAHHGKRTVGHGKAAIVSLADNKSSSHGFEEERLSPWRNGFSISTKRFALADEGTIERNEHETTFCDNASHCLFYAINGKIRI
jgi:hypothetical protein